MIITTNYDPHVESAYQKANQSYTVLTHVTNREHPKWGYILVQNSTKPDEVIAIIEPSELVLSDYPSDTIIYKIHGTFSLESWSEYDTIIITKNDYVDFLVMIQARKFPPAIAKALQQHHILFLGYGLEDWNFRVILRNIQLSAQLGQKYLSWAIQLRPSVLEARFWQSRNVALYDVDLYEFVETLKRQQTL